MAKRIFIVHGYTGNPDNNWFPWLKRKLTNHGFEPVVPAMPTPDTPQEKEWVKTLSKAIGKPARNTYLVGHSLGCATILRYLESLPKGTQIGGAVLVAAFNDSVNIDEIENFINHPFDYDRISAAANQFVVINSNDDQYVPLAQGKDIANKLSCELKVVKNGGHLNAEDGFTELPIVLESILKIAR